MRLHPLTENQPKPLLNVGDKSILEHIVDKLQETEKVDEIFIVTNHKFYPMFNEWLNDYNSKKKIKIINDGTLSNEDRLGAIGDLNFVLNEEKIDDDILMIAGDNLFGFDLDAFCEKTLLYNAPLSVDSIIYCSFDPPNRIGIESVAFTFVKLTRCVYEPFVTRIDQFRKC